ncbi:MAG: LCP family protein [Eubacteriales bacterium]
MRKIIITNKKRFIIVSVIALILIVSISIGVAFYNKMRNPEKLFDGNNGEDEDISLDVNSQFDKSKVNILIFGLDKNEYRDKEQHYQFYRSDTIMVATIDLEEDTVDIVSIPRDTYTSIYETYGKDKINAAFYYGQKDAGSDEDEMKKGVEYLINTASDVLGGIPINYYIGITDMDVVTEIIDELGGIEIDVLHTLYADKGHDKSKVEIKSGLQTLNGKQLQYYARYRTYPLGDIDRVSNQQHIIKALLDNLKKTNSLIKLPKIYKMVSEKLTTNLSFEQISALSLFGLRLDRENLTTYTLPGDFGELGGLSYWIINQSKRSSLLKEIYGIDVPPEKQEATSDELIQLTSTVDKKTLLVGEKTRLTISGKTADGKNLSYDINDTKYSVSAEGIVQLNADNTVVAKAPGNVTLTFKVEGISASTKLTVQSPVVEEPEEEPQDTTKPTFEGISDITINQGTKFNPKDGIKAWDDGKSINYTVSGNVDVNVTETTVFSLTYTAVDEANNITIVTRKITVKVEKTEVSDSPPTGEGTDAGI